MLSEAVERYPKTTAIVASVLLISLAIAAYWNFIWQNPERVFSDMLANNLSTSSVTKGVAASSSQGSLLQYVRLQMGSTNAAQWLVTDEQSGNSVTTDSIGTRTTAYIRYTQISTQASTKQSDFSRALNVWAKSDGKTDTALSNLFDQSLLDIGEAPIPPIGNLPSAERQNILGYMTSQNIFEPNYHTLKREQVNGRGVITYSVAVHMGPYVRMMQAFAHDLGLTSLDTVDPNQYSTLAPLTLTMSIDRFSHQLVKISYPGSGFNQSYTDWGLSSPIKLPQTTISTTELQQRLQSLK